MLDSIYHMTLKLFLKSYFGVKCLGFAICVRFKASFHNVSRKSVNHKWFINFNARVNFTLRRDVI